MNFVCMIGIDGPDMAEMTSGSASDDKRASANTPTSVVDDVEFGVYDWQRWTGHGKDDGWQCF